MALARAAAGPGGAGSGCGVPRSTQISVWQGGAAVVELVEHGRVRSAWRCFQARYACSPRSSAFFWEALGALAVVSVTSTSASLDASSVDVFSLNGMLNSGWDVKKPLIPCGIGLIGCQLWFRMCMQRHTHARMQPAGGSFHPALPGNAAGQTPS